VPRSILWSFIPLFKVMLDFVKVVPVFLPRRRGGRSSFLHQIFIYRMYESIEKNLFSRELNPPLKIKHIIMASYGTMHRPTASSSSASKANQPEESKDSTRKKRNDFKLLCPFDIPLSPEAAAVRIIRNLGYFGLYYTTFVWIILFISLVPKRKVSLMILVAMTVVTCFYLILLRVLPNSVVLHKVIDKRLVLASVAVVTAVELIVTRAAIHLCVTLACGIPIILVHAVLRVRDDLFVGEEACAAGELVPLVRMETGDVESLASSV